AVVALMLVPGVASDYRQAAISHDATLAAQLRTETRLMAEVDPKYARLAAAVAKTREQFRPWPTADAIDALAPGTAAKPPAKPYDAIRRELGAVDGAHDRRARIVASLDALALSRGLGIDYAPLLTAVDRGTKPDTGAVRDQVSAVQQSRG